MRTHTEEKTYVCSCGKGYKNNKDLKKHLKKAKNPLEHRSLHISNRAGIQAEPNTSRNSEKSFACDYEGCDASFAKNFTLNRHKKTHMSPKELLAESESKGNVCKEPQCKNKFFTQISHFERHKLTHTKQKPHMCNCGKKYSDKHNLIKHVKKGKDSLKHFILPPENTETKASAPFPAFDPSLLEFNSDAPFNQDFLLNENTGFLLPLSPAVALHDSIDTLPNCDPNDPLFGLSPQTSPLSFLNLNSTNILELERENKTMVSPSSDSLSTPEKRKTIEHQEEVVLPPKKKRLSNRAGIQAEPNTPKPFACDHKNCPASFAKKNALNSHKRIHMTPKELLALGKGHVCKEPQCKDKFFIQKTNYDRHMLGHAKQTPYMCNCGKKYLDKYTLRNHVNKGKDSLKHFILPPKNAETKAQDFPLNENIGFPLPLSPVIDMQVTSQKKPFACNREDCNKTFTEKRSLKRHAFTHLSEVDYVF